MEPRIGMNRRKAESLEPIAHVGAHRIPHEIAGDVFGSDDAAQVTAQLLHAFAVVTGIVSTPLKEPRS